MKNRSNEINIGFQLDPEYILRTMITVASIMDSQKKNTGIRLHFIVVFLILNQAFFRKYYTWI